MFDDFDAPELDRTVWLPHYLPAWSSLAGSRASYLIHDSHLELSIPPEQGLWCPGEHQPPLRVSGLQTGNFSGPAGSTAGQQPFREGLRVREAQEEFRGCLLEHGTVGMRASLYLGTRSMASLWLIGFEDQPQRSGEICVMEVFGRDVGEEEALVGMGFHAFRDPRLTEDFEKVPLPIDVTEPHAYEVSWDGEEATFRVDGRVVRMLDDPPQYPLQVMLAVFDFPDGSDPASGGFVPTLSVDRVWAH
ncbi:MULTISPECIES: glycoside hydrolase family 16 protein [unclassified Leifsonia]|uniref:glycoside hydrolase family 16 protein n=1 Tax=unclassified Leifsonia TaxID=2663824 RepID=UPI0008A7873C|nr:MULTISPECIES: glycoside hydrolase family 16 protein [unclassified Leifsonia]SEI11132.1 Glycosyl hydrolases family 16 [Leifsonia sp. CL154]SFL89246.1 Glycosyl hydrolases family 16 [Leifsonia sp. CL147]